MLRMSNVVHAQLVQVCTNITLLDVPVLIWAQIRGDSLNSGGFVHFLWTMFGKILF